MHKDELEDAFEGLKSHYRQVKDVAERLERIAYLDHLRAHQPGTMGLCGKPMCRAATELREAMDS